MEEKCSYESPDWNKEIQDMIKKGYSYELAYALISKRKVQEMFDKDIRINEDR